MSKTKRVAIERAETDRGATMVEYALIVGAIAMVVVIGAGVFGQGVLALFDDVVAAM